jgi:hypothetical protein
LGEALAGGALSGGTLPRRTLAGCSAALGVFRRFQVTHFHYFFLGSHILTISSVLFVVVDVSRAEEQLTTARDVSFWDEVIEPNQFFLFALLFW